jgi:IgA Peptidase M64
MAGRCWYALVALILATCATGTAQTNFYTITTNGPSSNRFNLVFLSEGYPPAQAGQFLIDCTNALNGLLSRAPFAEYRSCFNAYAISVPSVDSGSDHPGWPLLRDTYFNSSYSIDDLTITIPPNAFDNTYADGQGKVDALLQTYMPLCQAPVLLVNDSTSGGSDGFDKTAITSTGVARPDILAHEIGHVMANLGDEYTNANPGFPNTEEPNTTQETRTNYIKWKAWIAPSTPIPTPATASYTSVIGLFQGAHYHITNWYRPKYDCTMNHRGAPFCEVCGEALVLALYGKIRPVDAFTPASTNFSISTTQAVTFQLSLLQPSTHRLAVQWSTNGIAVPLATNALFTLLPAALSNGTHQLSAMVTDPTTLVRNDPTNLLQQTVRWTLDVNILQLRLDSPAWLNGGNFAFRVSGNAPQGFLIQTSTNLLNWTALSTNFLSGGVYWYTNRAVGPLSNRLYRAVTPP